MQGRLKRAFWKNNRAAGLGGFVADLDVQGPQGALALAEQEVETLLGPANLVANAVHVLSDRFAVLLHFLETAKLALDARLNVAQSRDVARVASRLGSRDESHA